jgi:hypothetical protein
MKKLMPLVLLVFVWCANAKAQKIDTAVFKKHLGEVATLCDTVSTFRVISDTLTLVNMGGVYPHQKFTVALKGKGVIITTTNLKGKHLCVTGVLTLFKNQLEIVAQEPKQIEVE